MYIRRIYPKAAPQPRLISPTCEEEALYGIATLLTPGHIETLLGALRGSRKWKDPDLIIKLEELKT